MVDSFDRRQRQLLRLLREAGDVPVSIEALRDHGIENPGTAIYELELAGYSIERSYTHPSSGGRRLIGFRLIDGEKGQPRPRR